MAVSPESVRAEFKKTRPAESRTTEDHIDGQKEEETTLPPSPHEIQLLKILVAGEAHLQFAATHLDLQWLVHPIIKRTVQRLLENGNVEATAAGAWLALFQDDGGAQQLLSAVLADDRPVPQPAQQLKDVLTHLRNDAITAELQSLSRRLAQPDISDAERLAALERQKELRTAKQRPLEGEDGARSAA